MPYPFHLLDDITAVLTVSRHYFVLRTSASHQDTCHSRVGAVRGLTYSA